MNPLSTTRALHPVQWVAAIAVTLFAAVGIGAITGIIPSSKSAETPVAQTPVSPTADAQPGVTAAASPAASTVITAAPLPEPIPVSKTVVKHKAAVKHPNTQIVRAEPVADATPPPPPAPRICDDCGRIESIQRIEHEGDGSGVGAVAGGAIGGLLGNGVGQGRGRTVATIAGVVGGAMLGNHVEKSQKKTVSYQTTVRFDNGDTQVFNNPNEQGLREGERVRVVNGAIRPE